MANRIEIKVGLDTKQADAELQGFQRRFKSAIDPAIASTNTLRTAVGLTTVAFIGLTAAIKSFADVSIRAAVEVNKQVNLLKALTGSAEAAEKRFAALFALAQKTPGLTTNLAATLDAQLRIFNVAERTIDRLLPVIGRLNAISPLGDPKQFVNNLTQLISQNFERQDLKELVGQSPIAGKLIQQIFNVDNPTNAEAIRTAAKRLGVNTVERLAEELIKASATNSALQNATESFAGQFEKLQDRITVALAPIGTELLKTLLPAFKELVEVLERDLPKITTLLRDNKDEFLAVAGAVVSMAGAVGQLIGELGKLDQKFGIIRGLSLLAGSIISPGSTGAMLDIFQRQDQQSALLNAMDPFQRLAFARATGNKAAEPSRAELLEFAQHHGRLELLSQIPPEPAAPGRAGGGGRVGGGGAARVDRVAQEIADLRKKIADGNIEFMEQAVKDLEDLDKALQTINLEGEKQRKDNAAFIKQRLFAGRETRQRLTAEFDAQAAETLLRTSRRGLTRAGRFIGAGIERGQFTAGEAELLQQGAAGQFANQLREVLALKEKTLEINDPLLEDLRDEIALYDQLSVSISNTERFMRGFNSQVDSVGDAFDRFGQNVSNAFRNVRDLFDGLKRAVLSFFNDLIGNSLQNLVRGVLGPIFGGRGGSGSAGGFFQQAFAGAGGGGAPGSISSGLSSFFSGGAGLGPSLNRVGDPFAATQFGLSLPGSGGTSFLGRIGQSFAAAGPLLAIGGVLSLGSFLFGRAKQRRSDEEASGAMLTEALSAITQLKAAIASDQIDGGQARSIFESQILAQFVSGINSLKTKSVRQSRLTNQVRDLRKNFDDLIPPEVAAQVARRNSAASNALTHSRLIPEFASGGTSRGGLAILHPGEKILNFQQQSAVIRQSNPQVFERAGVPRGQSSGPFDGGGTFGGGGIPLEVSITLVMGKQDQTRAFVTGGNTPQGRATIVKSVNVARTNREL